MFSQGITERIYKILNPSVYNFIIIFYPKFRQIVVWKRSFVSFRFRVNCRVSSIFLYSCLLRERRKQRSDEGTKRVLSPRVKMCSHVVILAGSSRWLASQAASHSFYSVINSIYLRPVHRRIRPWYNLSVCRASLSPVRLVANSRPFRNREKPSILITAVVVQRPPRHRRAPSTQLLFSF